MTHETSDFINNITNSIIENYHQFPLDLESQLPKSSLEELISHSGDEKSEWLTVASDQLAFLYSRADVYDFQVLENSF